jgi:alpha-beta hydrolase superfamily lysophospholipase
MDPEYWARWHELYEDPLLVHHFTSKVGTIWVEEQAKAKELIQEITMPMLFLEAENEEVVCNKSIQEYAKLAKNPEGKNKYVNIPGCNHCLIAFDAVPASLAIKHTISYFNNIISGDLA